MKRRNRRKRKLKIKNFKRFIVIAVLVFGTLLSATVYIKDKITSNKVKQASISLSSSRENNAKNSITNKMSNGNEKSNNKVEVKDDIKTPIATNNVVSTNNLKKENTSVSNKEFFKDSIFLGDSITEPLSYYEILNDRNVIGVIGLSITKAYSMCDKIIERSPKNVFILLGQNDIAKDMNKNIENYSKLIRKIKNNLPTANIYVQSIMPILSKAENVEVGLNTKNIINFNEYIKKMAETENVKYIDLSSIFQNFNEKLYEPDGIHFKADFYNIWLNYLKNIIK